jgi:Na+-translocating ferredoxin:NAD+ oxidoreductase RnfD subunit
MYIAIMAIVSGLLGTVIALRLMAIDAQEKKSKLTARGRLVVGILCGILFALVVSITNNLWWDCDLRAGATTPCVVHWGL